MTVVDIAQWILITALVFSWTLRPTPPQLPPCSYVSLVPRSRSLLAELSKAGRTPVDRLKSRDVWLVECLIDCGCVRLTPLGTHVVVTKSGSEALRRGLSE